MDRTAETGNLIEFLQSLLATMDDIDTVSFLTEDLAGHFLQHHGRMPPRVISQVMELGKQLIGHASTHQRLAPPALLLLKNTMQWIENMGAGSHFHRVCYDSGICVSLASYLSASTGDDKETRSVIEHCVDVFSPLTQLPVPAAGKIQCLTCVAGRLDDMAADGYAQSKCLKFITNTLGTIAETRSLISCVRQVCPSLRSCLSSTDDRVADAAVDTFSRICKQCRESRTDRMAVATVLMRDVMPPLLTRLHPANLQGPRGETILRATKQALAMPEAVAALREGLPAARRMTSRIMRCLTAVGVAKPASGKGGGAGGAGGGQEEAGGKGKGGAEAAGGGSAAAAGAAAAAADDDTSDDEGEAGIAASGAGSTAQSGGEGLEGPDGDGADWAPGSKDVLSEDAETRVQLLTACLSHLCGGAEAMFPADEGESGGASGGGAGGGGASGGGGSNSGPSGGAASESKRPPEELVLRGIVALSRLAPRFRTLDSNAGLALLRLLRQLVASPHYLPVVDASSADAAGEAATSTWDTKVLQALRPVGPQLAKTLLHLVAEQPHLKPVEVDMVYSVLHRVVDACGGGVLALMVRGGLALKLQDTARDAKRAEEKARAVAIADGAYRLLQSDGTSAASNSQEDGGMHVEDISGGEAAATNKSAPAAASGAGEHKSTTQEGSDALVPRVDMAVDDVPIDEGNGGQAAYAFGPDGFGTDGKNTKRKQKGSASGSAGSREVEDRVQQLSRRLLERCIEEASARASSTTEGSSDSASKISDLVHTPAWLGDWYDLGACSGAFVGLCECTRALLRHAVKGTAEDWAKVDGDADGMTGRDRALVRLIQRCLPSNEEETDAPTSDTAADRVASSYGVATKLRQLLEATASDLPTQHEALHSGIGMAIGLYLGVADTNATAFTLLSEHSSALTDSSLPEGFPSSAFDSEEMDVVARTLALMRVLGGREALRSAETQAAPSSTKGADDGLGKPSLLSAFFRLLSLVVASTDGHGWSVRLHSRPFAAPREIASFAKRYSAIQFVPKRPDGQLLPSTVRVPSAAGEGKAEESESKAADLPEGQVELQNASTAYALVSAIPPVKMQASLESTAVDLQAVLLQRVRDFATGKSVGDLKRTFATVPREAWGGCGGKGEWLPPVLPKALRVAASGAGTSTSGLPVAQTAVPRGLSLKGVAVLPHERVVAASGNSRMALLCTMSKSPAGRCVFGLHVQSRVNCTARAAVGISRCSQVSILTSVGDSVSHRVPSYQIVGGRVSPETTVVVPPMGVVRNVFVLEEARGSGGDPEHDDSAISDSEGIQTVVPSITDALLSGEGATEIGKQGKAEGMEAELAGGAEGSDKSSESPVPFGAKSKETEDAWPTGVDIWWSFQWEFVTKAGSNLFVADSKLAPPAVFPMVTAATSLLVTVPNLGKSAIGSTTTGDYENCENDIAVIRRGPVCLHVVRQSDSTKQAELNAKGAAARIESEMDSAVSYQVPSRYPVMLLGGSRAMAKHSELEPKTKRLFLQYQFQSMFQVRVHVCAKGSYLPGIRPYDGPKAGASAAATSASARPGAEEDEGEFGPIAPPRSDEERKAVLQKRKDRNERELNGSGKGKSKSAMPTMARMDGSPPSPADLQKWSDMQEHGCVVTVYLPKYGPGGEELEFDRQVLSVEAGEMEAAQDQIVFQQVTPPALKRQDHERLRAYAGSRMLGDAVAGADESALATRTQSIKLTSGAPGKLLVNRVAPAELDHSKSLGSVAPAIMAEFLRTVADHADCYFGEPRRIPVGFGGLGAAQSTNAKPKVRTFFGFVVDLPPEAGEEPVPANDASIAAALTHREESNARAREFAEGVQGLRGVAGAEAAVSALESRRQIQEVTAKRMILAYRAHALAPMHERYVKIRTAVQAGESFNDVIRSRVSSAFSGSVSWRNPMGIRLDAVQEDAMRLLSKQDGTSEDPVAPLQSERGSSDVATDESKDKANSKSAAPEPSPQELLYPCNPDTMLPLSDKALRVVRCLFRCFASFPLESFAKKAGVELRDPVEWTEPRQASDRGSDGAADGSAASGGGAEERSWQETTNPAEDRPQALPDRASLPAYEGMAARAMTGADFLRIVVSLNEWCRGSERLKVISRQDFHMNLLREMGTRVKDLPARIKETAELHARIQSGGEITHDGDSADSTESKVSSSPGKKKGVMEPRRRMSRGERMAASRPRRFGPEDVLLLRNAFNLPAPIPEACQKNSLVVLEEDFVAFYMAAVKDRPEAVLADFFNAGIGPDLQPLQAVSISPGFRVKSVAPWFDEEVAATAPMGFLPQCTLRAQARHSLGMPLPACGPEDESDDGQLGRRRRMSHEPLGGSGEPGPRQRSSSPGPYLGSSQGGADPWALEGRGRPDRQRSQARRASYGAIFGESDDDEIDARMRRRLPGDEDEPASGNPLQATGMAPSKQRAMGTARIAEAMRGGKPEKPALPSAAGSSGQKASKSIWGAHIEESPQPYGYGAPPKGAKPQPKGAEKSTSKPPGPGSGIPGYGGYGGMGSGLGGGGYGGYGGGMDEDEMLRQALAASMASAKEDEQKRKSIEPAKPSPAPAKAASGGSSAPKETKSKKAKSISGDSKATGGMKLESAGLAPEASAVGSAEAADDGLQSAVAAAEDVASGGAAGAASELAGAARAAVEDASLKQVEESPGVAKEGLGFVEGVPGETAAAGGPDAGSMGFAGGYGGSGGGGDYGGMGSGLGGGGYGGYGGGMDEDEMLRQVLAASMASAKEDEQKRKSTGGGSADVGKTDGGASKPDDGPSQPSGEASEKLEAAVEGTKAGKEIKTDAEPAGGDTAADRAEAKSAAESLEVKIELDGALEVGGSAPESADSAAAAIDAEGATAAASALDGEEDEARSGSPVAPSIAMDGVGKKKSAVVPRTAAGSVLASQGDGGGVPPEGSGMPFGLRGAGATSGSFGGLGGRGDAAADKALTRWATGKIKVGLSPETSEGSSVRGRVDGAISAHEQEKHLEAKRQYRPDVEVHAGSPPVFDQGEFLLEQQSASEPDGSSRSSSHHSKADYVESSSDATRTVSMGALAAKLGTAAVEGAEVEEWARSGVHDADATAPLLAWAAKLANTSVPTPSTALGDVDPTVCSAEQAAFELLQGQAVSSAQEATKDEAGQPRSTGEEQSAPAATAVSHPAAPAESQQAQGDAKSPDRPGGSVPAKTSEPKAPASVATGGGAADSAFTDEAGPTTEPMVAEADGGFQLGPPVHRLFDMVAASQAVEESDGGTAVVARAAAATVNVVRVGSARGPMGSVSRIYNSVAASNPGHSHEELRLVDYVNAKAGYYSARQALQTAAASQDHDADDTAGKKEVGEDAAAVAQKAADDILRTGSVRVISAAQALDGDSLLRHVQRTSASEAAKGSAAVVPEASAMPKDKTPVPVESTATLGLLPTQKVRLYVDGCPVDGDATTYAISNSSYRIKQLAKRVKRWDRLGLRVTGGSTGTAGGDGKKEVAELHDSRINELLQEAEKAADASGGSEDPSGSTDKKQAWSEESSAADDQVAIKKEWIRGVKQPPTGIDPPEEVPAAKYVGCYVLVPYTQRGSDMPTFYGGIVAEYSPTTQLHVVEYDDGEVTEHSLRVEVHVVLALPHQHGGREAQLRRMRANRQSTHLPGGAKKVANTEELQIEYELYDEREDPANHCRKSSHPGLGLPVLAAESTTACAAPIPNVAMEEDTDSAIISGGATSGWKVGASIRYDGPCAADLPGTLGPVPLYTADRQQLDQAIKRGERGYGFRGQDEGDLSGPSILGLGRATTELHAKRAIPAALKHLQQHFKDDTLASRAAACTVVAAVARPGDVRQGLPLVLGGKLQDAPAAQPEDGQNDGAPSAAPGQDEAQAAPSKSGGKPASEAAPSRDGLSAEMRRGVVFQGDGDSDSSPGAMGAGTNVADIDRVALSTKPGRSVLREDDDEFEDLQARAEALLQGAALESRAFAMSAADFKGQAQRSGSPLPVPEHQWGSGASRAARWRGGSPAAPSTPQEWYDAPPTAVCQYTLLSRALIPGKGSSEAGTVAGRGSPQSAPLSDGAEDSGQSSAPRPSKEAAQQPLSASSTGSAIAAPAKSTQRREPPTAAGILLTMAHARRTALAINDAWRTVPSVPGAPTVYGSRVLDYDFDEGLQEDTASSADAKSGKAIKGDDPRYKQLLRAATARLAKESSTASTESTPPKGNDFGRLSSRLAGSNVPVTAALRAMQLLCALAPEIAADQSGGSGGAGGLTAEGRAQQENRLLPPAATAVESIADRLVQQMQDNVSLAFAAVPRWVTLLPKLEPRLLPLALRRKVFFALGFGRSRALLHVQHELGAAHPGDTAEDAAKRARKRDSDPERFLQHELKLTVARGRGLVASAAHAFRWWCAPMYSYQQEARRRREERAMIADAVLPLRRAAVTSTEAEPAAALPASGAGADVLAPGAPADREDQDPSTMGVFAACVEGDVLAELRRSSAEPKRLEGQDSLGRRAAVLSITFEGEDAHGEGVTREFYTLLFRSLQQTDLGLWRTVAKEAAGGNEEDCADGAAADGDEEGPVDLGVLAVETVADNDETGEPPSVGGPELAAVSAAVPAGQRSLSSSATARTESMAAIVANELNAMSEVEYAYAPNGLFPRPLPGAGNAASPQAARDAARVLDLFVLQGRAVAKALQDGHHDVLDLPLSPSFCKLLTGRPLGLSDLAEVEPDMAGTCHALQRLLHALDEAELRNDGPLRQHVEDQLELYCLTWEVGSPPVELCPEGGDRDVDASCLRSFVSALVDRMVVRPAVAQARAFLHGYQCVADPTALRMFGPDELADLLSDSRSVGATDHLWAPASIRGALAFHRSEQFRYAPDDAPIRYLAEVLSQLEPKERKLFLEFATASSRLPADGFSGLRPRPLQVNKRLPRHGLESADDLPLTCRVCSYELALPEYSSAAVTKSRVLEAIYSISDGLGGFRQNA